MRIISQSSEKKSKIKRIYLGIIDIKHIIYYYIITISNTILPDIVYKYSDTKKTILTGFTDEFLTNPNTYNMCDTMQIVRNVVSIDTKSFFKLGGGSTIPSFITNLTFAKRSNCTSIGQAAFYLSPLTTIKLNNTLETIGIDAFADSLKLASVDFPSSLQSIGESAFVRDYELTSISFPEDNNGKYGLATNLGDNAQVVVEKESDGNYK